MPEFRRYSPVIFMTGVLRIETLYKVYRFAVGGTAKYHEHSLTGRAVAHNAPRHAAHHPGQPRLGSEVQRGSAGSSSFPLHLVGITLTSGGVQTGRGGGSDRTALPSVEELEEPAAGPLESTCTA